MKFVPHKYQQIAIEHIIEHPEAAVFLDMGLGKTVITLTALNELMFDCFESRKVLIIAPLRVARDTWKAEIEKWEHLKGLTYSIAVGSEKERRAALNKKADLYIINRENVQWLVERSGYEFDFDTVVIDELSSFKSIQAQRFKALNKVRHKISRIVGLTGTPSPNGLMDLFAEFKLLDGGERLGKFIGGYRARYFIPDKFGGAQVYSYRPIKGADKIICDKISDITISMTAQDNLKMPELVSVEHLVQLSEKERKIYDSMKKEMSLLINGEEINAKDAALLTGKLMQMANGAVYSDDKNTVAIHSRKLDALEDIIESMNGNPLLVAYWFKHDLARIEERLQKLKINYAKLDSEESIKAWNNRELEVGLIHPASAGHGLNLQSGGSAICWYSLTYSLELYQQTIARLWRQGQKAKTVVVKHIVCENTIDEQILKTLERKDGTQAALIEAVKAELG